MNPKPRALTQAHSRSNNPIMLTRLLSLILLLVALSAPAETFYLLSKESSLVSPPYPFNPNPQAPAYLVIDDIFIVDDTLFATNKKELLPLAEAKVKLLHRMEKANAAAVEYQRTNPPVEVFAVPYQRPKPLWINTNATNLGYARDALEALRPGLSTNFTAEQMKLPVLPTNASPQNGPQQLPPHIHRSSPTFETDLQQWKENRRKELELPSLPSDFKGSGGGDYTFLETTWYQVEVTTLKSPEIWSPHTNASTGEMDIYDTFPAGSSRYDVFDGFTNTFNHFTNHTVVTLISNNSFFLSVVYPEIVGGAFAAFPLLTNWPSARVDFYGECYYSGAFSISNIIWMPEGYNGYGHDITVSSGCFGGGAPLTSIQVTPITLLSPDSGTIDWGQIRGLPYIKQPMLTEPPPPVPIPSKLRSAGPSFQRFDALSSSSVAPPSWLHHGSATSGLSGTVEFDVNPTNATEFFQVSYTK